MNALVATSWPFRGLKKSTPPSAPTRTCSSSPPPIPVYVPGTTEASPPAMQPPPASATARTNAREIAVLPMGVPLQQEAADSPQWSLRACGSIPAAKSYCARRSRSGEELHDDRQGNVEFLLPLGGDAACA